MKKLARKFLAMLLTAAIAVSGMVMTTVSAGAETIADKAVELEATELVSKKFENSGDSEYYEINLPKAGDITIRDAKAYDVNVYLLDANGNDIGGHHWGTMIWGTDYTTNCSTDYKELDKGRYYIRVSANKKDSYINDLNYSFNPTQKATISISTTIKKGSTLQLGSVTENYDGKVTWLSTKKSIATVSSKGLVTAKKAGTTYIRAQMDNGDYVEIKVVVKKK